MGKIDSAVEELSRFLDTFYSDVEGWLELAHIYSSCNQYGPFRFSISFSHDRILRYTYALQSLSHALLLNPQNPFYFQHAAEIAYTSGDITLAIKMFLLVIDMTDEDVPVESIPTGIAVRAWFGIKLVRSFVVANKFLLDFLVDILPQNDSVHVGSSTNHALQPPRSQTPLHRIIWLS